MELSLYTSSLYTWYIHLSFIYIICDETIVSISKVNNLDEWHLTRIIKLTIERVYSSFPMISESAHIHKEDKR